MWLLGHLIVRHRSQGVILSLISDRLSLVLISRMCVTESAGVLLDAGPEYHLARALLQPAAPQHHPTAALPSMGDVPLAVHVLLSQARPQVSTYVGGGLCFVLLPPWPTRSLSGHDCVKRVGPDLGSSAFPWSLLSCLFFELDVVCTNLGVQTGNRQP